MMRPFASEKISSNAGITARSDGVRPGTVAFVEWPEHGGEWLPEIRATVTLNHVDESHRQVKIDSEDDLGL